MLYVGRDRSDPNKFCPGSMVCMSLVEKIQTPIQVQDCSVLRRHQRMPDWLNGTPIFVDQGGDAEPLRGTEAVRALQRLLSAQPLDEDEEDDDDVVVAEPRPSGAAMPRMQQPIATREPSARPTRTDIVPPPPLSGGASGQVARPDDAFASIETTEDELLPDTMANGTSGSSNAPVRDGKVTDDDLQRFMEARKQSLASAQPSSMPQQ